MSTNLIAGNTDGTGSDPSRTKLLRKDPVLILLMLIVSVSSLDYSIKTSAILLCMLFIGLGKHSDLRVRLFRDRLGFISRSFLVVLFPSIALILGIHVAANELSLSALLSDANTVFMLFLFAPIMTTMCVSLSKIENMVDAINVFLISFSVIYLAIILVNGLPDGRESALGYISSNYVASFLLFCYPLLIYYYAANDKRLRSRRFKWSAFGIVMSFVVVLTTGSRTALGVVGVLLVALIFLPTITHVQRLKTVMALSVIAIVVVATAIVSPEIQSLLERAFGALRGGAEVSDDVRYLIWSQGWDNFLNGNILFGNGYSIVPEFDAPAHNLFLEILLQVGCVGLALYLISYVAIMYRAIKNQNSLKKYSIITLVAIFGVTAFFQPFFTTGYTCGILFWCSIFTIILDVAEANVCE